MVNSQIASLKCPETATVVLQKDVEETAKTIPYFFNFNCGFDFNINGH